MRPEEVFMVTEYCYEESCVLAVFYDEDKAKAYERKKREGKQGWGNVDWEVVSMIVEDA